jgi:hypothetical protein
VEYYINEIIEFNTTAAFLQRPFNKTIQKKIRLIIFITNITAPTDFNDEQSARI